MRRSDLAEFSPLTALVRWTASDFDLVPLLDDLGRLFNLSAAAASVSKFENIEPAASSSALRSEWLLLPLIEPSAVGPKLCRSKERVGLHTG
jgi:hypothetical protein